VSGPDRVCWDCEVAWRTPDPCWSCGAPGVIAVFATLFKRVSSRQTAPWQHTAHAAIVGGV
jgi:hypothetical protein